MSSASCAADRTARPRYVFTARLSDSLVGLSLPAHTLHPDGPSGRATLDAAKALYEAERWLPALEDWLGAGLLPELSAVTGPLAESRMFTRHVLVSQPGPGAHVHLPMSLLSGLRESPPVPFSQWTWKSVRSELVLDTLPLGPAEWPSLEAGALVLLPASFSTPPWMAMLQPMGGQDGAFAVRLRESRGRLCASGAGEVGSSVPCDHATVRFRRSVEAHPFELFGWRGNVREAVELETPALLTAGAILVQASAAMHSQPLATGQLIPVGSGFAVRIDAMAVE